MVKVKISETEYKGLKRQARAYRKFATEVLESVIKDPIDQVVEDFRKTGLYSKEFLKDLESGLRKSTWSKKSEKNED